MAIQTGAHSSYDEAVTTAGNREDLSDVVWDVTPADTPLLTAMKKNKATATNHEWLTDALTTASANAQLEGDANVTAADPAARGRLGNYTQRMLKHAVVTHTQEKVLKGGGIKSEMAYQQARRMRELKTDGEHAMLGVSNAKVGGAEGTAREMGSLDTYLANGVAGTEFAAATSANPTGDGTDVPNKGGTDRALTETIFAGTLENLYGNSGGNENIMAIVPAAQKTVISSFTASSTRYVTTDDKKLVASIDVYDGDFHTVKVTPDRFCIAGSVFLIDPEYIACSELIPMTSYDLAKTGSSYRKEMEWEWTLEVCDPNAHAHIFDLS